MNDLVAPHTDGRALFTWHILHALPDTDDEQLERAFSSLPRFSRQFWRYYQADFARLCRDGDAPAALENLDISAPRYEVLVNWSLGQEAEKYLDPIKQIHTIVQQLETSPLNTAERSALFSHLSTSFRQSADGFALFLYHSLLKRDGLLESTEDVCLAIGAWATLAGPVEDDWRQQTQLLVTGCLSGSSGSWRKHLLWGQSPHTSNAKDNVDTFEHWVKTHQDDAEPKTSKCCFSWLSEQMMQSLPPAISENKRTFVEALLLMLRQHIMALFGSTFDRMAPLSMHEGARDVWYAVRLHAHGELKLAERVDQDNLSLVCWEVGLSPKLLRCFEEEGLSEKEYAEMVKQALHGWNAATGREFRLDREPIMDVGTGV